MWLINSSIGRKVVMSVTGIALILFLTFHCAMNIVALFSGEAYNMICELLGANWYAVAATLGLAALAAVHIVYAFLLTIQNRRARGNNRYAVTNTPEKVEWASQNMLVLGIIICLGLFLHLFNFWSKMQLVELVGNDPQAEALAANGAFHIAKTFSNPIFTVLYMVWLCALWLHMNHGIWSSVQTLGWSGKIWFHRWRIIGSIFATIVILMFVAVALAYCFGYRPADFNEVVPACALSSICC